MHAKEQPAEEQIQKRKESRLHKIPGRTGNDHCWHADGRHQHTLERALYLLLANGVRQTGKAGHEIVQHREAGQPGGQRIAPLLKSRIGEPREDLRNEKERRDYNQNREDAEKELHPVTEFQAPVARHKSPDPAEKQDHEARSSLSFS